MERRLNPYATPQARLADGHSEPTQWQRVKWVFGALALTLAPLALINAFFVPYAPDPAVLLLNSGLALALAGFIARDLWRLKVRRFPLAVDILIYAVGMGGLAALIVLKETGIYVWHSLHLDLPAVLALGGIAAAAWITEARKRVRIYAGMRHFMFFKATE